MSKGAEEELEGGHDFPPFNSEGWKRMQAEMAGRRPEERPWRAPEGGSYEASYLRGVADRLDRLETPPKKPLFDFQLNLATIIALGSIMAGAVTFGVTSSWNIYSAIDKVQKGQTDNVNEIKGLISTLANKQDTLQSKLAEDERASAERVARYAPQIEDLQKAASVTDTRIDNLSKSVADLRDSVQDLAKVSNQTHTDLEVMRVQIVPRLGGPQH